MKDIIKNILNRIRTSLIIFRYKLWQANDKEMSKFLKSLKIMSMDDTLTYIHEHKCSIARYGDGEFYIMGGGSNLFQKVDDNLAKRLCEILSNTNPNLLICIPSFLNNLRPFIQNTRLTGYGFRQVYLKTCVIPYIQTGYVYGDSLISRFYMIWRKKDKAIKYVESLKRLWDKENILIVEGYTSRLGVGNDLFNNASSICRIICPQENAYDKYSEIFETVKEYANSKLVIIALGMTATVLAYDLSKLGIRALDLGHIDIEYEWFKMKATKKVYVPNKTVAEVGAVCTTHLDNREYNSQILSKI